MLGFFNDFLKKIGNFGGPSWRCFNIKNRIFGGSKRVSKIKLIFKAFWHRFWDDFRGSGNVKNEVFVWKGCIFFDFRGLQDKDRFGAVLEGSGGRFSELFGRFWVDFGALKRRPILKPKLEAEKVVLKSSKRR